MRSLAAALMLVALAPGGAQAQRGAGGWERYLEPDRAQGERYLHLGLRRLVTALGDLDASLDPPQHLLLEQALLRFERARVTLGDDPRLAYYRAHALSAWERPATDGGTEHRTEEAIDAWTRVRALDPDLYPARVASELAVLHMRRHEFAVARAEYERALERAVPRPVELGERFYLPTGPERRLRFLHGPVDRGTLYGNLAEVTMLAGDVEAALASYRAAIGESGHPVSRALAQWGLALALERSGDHDGAIRQAQRALEADPIPPQHPVFADLHRRHGPFSVLHLDSVFFEPPYEVHAYEALGHEALWTDQGGDGGDHLTRARRSWRLFLAEGGTASRFATLARERLARLDAAADD